MTDTAIQPGLEKKKTRATGATLTHHIEQLYGLSKQTNGLFTVGLIVTICLTVVAYSQVVERKTHLQTVIEQTQRMNEENNSLHVQLNQAQAYQGVIARQKKNDAGLQAPRRTLALNGMSRSLTPPSAARLHQIDPSLQVGALPMAAPISRGY